jgi:hypothetical protein
LLGTAFFAFGSGCTQEAPPAESSDVISVQLTANTVSGLPQCTSSLAGEVAFVTSPPSLWRCDSAGQWLKISCSQSRSGQVAYASATKTLLACIEGQWSQVVLPPGPQGPQGSTGAESLINVTAEPPGKNCPYGGERIDVGVDTDGDGILQQSEVQHTTYVCNGAPGSVAVTDAGSDTSTTCQVKGNLAYNGGPVISNVVLDPVYYPGSVADTSQANTFYTTLASSTYLGWLSQYSTVGIPNGSNQTIGAGSFGAGTALTMPAPSTIDDSVIETTLQGWLTSGVVPPPQTDSKGRVNSVYVIHFPASTSVTAGGGTSCQAFCAYHNTLTSGSLQVPYAVIPDCFAGGGCGGNTAFEETTIVASHEIAQAITDPDVGFNVLAWYSQTQGEIADICNGQSGTNSGYSVQRLWSDLDQACVVTGNPHSQCGP